ncbi:MAG: U32 family peptidase, partial [Treponema sp.]|nr:U32 family peptidase [Treponema sp.]
MNKLELLAPAGSPEALDAAVSAGADAVYFGLKDFNARSRSVNFAYSQAEAAVKSLRRLGKKSYITVNTVFEQRESDRICQMLNYLSRIRPDGVIVQDFGIVEMIKNFFPKFPKLHASTQMNIASARGV